MFDRPILPFPAQPIPRYQSAWFAPSTSALALSLAVPEAKRYCSGEKFTIDNPHMARVHAETSDTDIDWNGNALVDLERVRTGRQLR